MRTVFIITSTLLCLLWAGFTPEPTYSPSAPNYVPELRKMENTSFQKGEFLKYRVHYGPINAGFLTMEVEPKSYIVNGRKCMHLVSTGYSNSFFEKIYHLYDVYESYMDEEALISWQFNREIQEGKYRSYTEIHFDQHQQQAKYINRKNKITHHETPKNIQDVVSAFYYARARYDAKALKVGDRITLKNFIDKKTVNLEAILLKREEIKIKGKKFKSMKFKLNVEESGLITDGAKISLWIADDENLIPLRFASKLKVGTLKADLVEYKNVKNEFSALVEE